MTNQQSIDAPNAVIEEYGPPERVFRYQRKLWVTLLMVASILLGMGLIGFSSLLLLVFHTSDSSEMRRTTVAIASIYIFCGLVTGPGLLMLYWPYRVLRKGREGFATYVDALVHFRGRRLKQVPFTDVADVIVPESGRGRTTIQLRNGEHLSIPKRLPGAGELAELITKSTKQRTLQDVVTVLSAKQSVDFGLLSADVTGLTYQGVRTDWNSLDRIEVEPGSCMTVFQRQDDGTSNAAFAVSEANIQDQPLLMELLGNLSPNLVQTVQRQPEPKQTEQTAVAAPARPRVSIKEAVVKAGSNEAAEENLARFQLLAYGLLLLLSCFYLNHVFAQLASGEADSVRLWWGFVLLYNTVGPTLTVAISGFVGVILTVMGVNNAFFQTETESGMQTA